MRFAHLFALAMAGFARQQRHMQVSLTHDHLVVAARTLDEGAAYVEAVLGLKLVPGGQHALMGTHNLLLGMGESDYLEVIAIDPEAQNPDWPRWYSLDRFGGAPKLTNWACRTDDLEAALEAAPPGTGTPVDLARGDLTWAMGIPPSGDLPFDNMTPALLEWAPGGPHPCQRLPDSGARLVRLDVFHPMADRLTGAFPALRNLAQVDIRTGPEPRLIATIATPFGTRVLA